MDKIVVASMHMSAGKTSVILGLAKASKKRCGYMKPFGDRLLYSKKRLWDYDSALITKALDMEESPEDISLGFEHSKLRFLYDGAGLKEKMNEMVAHIGKDRDVIFIEAGKDLMYGASVDLDAISLAKHLDAGLLIVVSGDEGAVADEIGFLKEYIDIKGVRLLGVIANKVKDPKGFKETMGDLGVKVLGVVPFRTELTQINVEYLSKAILAKVITGEQGLKNKIKNVFVGAMSAETAIRNPLFKKDNKLIITPGDRHDLIIAALEADTAGIVITCNVLPDQKVISKASEKGIPILLMPQDTFKVAKMIDDTEPLLALADPKRIETVEKLIRDNVDLDAIFG